VTKPVTKPEQVLIAQGLKIGSYFRYNGPRPVYSRDDSDWIGVITGLPWRQKTRWLVPVRYLDCDYRSEDAVAPAYLCAPISEEEVAVYLLDYLGAEK
jgi:hypothetical protein